MRTRVLQEKNYAERMQNGVEPYLAAHAEEFYWERESGHPIHVLRYRAFRPRGVVVISHGFTEMQRNIKRSCIILSKSIFMFICRNTAATERATVWWMIRRLFMSIPTIVM